MSPLPESRWRGLMEAFGCKPVTAYEGLSVWFTAFFILKEMGKQPEEVRRKFDNELRKGWIESDENYFWAWMTPARIAQAAADALGVLK